MVHTSEPAYVQQTTYVEPVAQPAVAVAQPAVAVAKPVYQVAEPVAVQPAIHHTVAPVVHHAKPVVHHTVAPVVHHPKPVVHHPKPVVAPAPAVRVEAVARSSFPYHANIKPAATVHHSAPVVSKRVYHADPKPTVVSSLGHRSYVRPTVRSHASRTYTKSYRDDRHYS